MKRTTIILIMALLPLMLSAGKTQQALIAMADSAYNQKLYTEAADK